MITHDKFFLVHMYRTGGAYLKYLCLNFIPGSKFVGEHVGIREADPFMLKGRAKVGVIRDPWSWYYSRYLQNLGKEFNSSFSDYLDQGKDRKKSHSYTGNFCRFFCNPTKDARNAAEISQVGSRFLLDHIVDFSDLENSFMTVMAKIGIRIERNDIEEYNRDLIDKHKTKFYNSSFERHNLTGNDHLNVYGRDDCWFFLVFFCHD